MGETWRVLETPPLFRLTPTVLSHGWVFLAPFQWDEAVLSFPSRHGRRKSMIKIREHAKSVVFSPALPGVEPIVRWVLRLDEDLSPLADRAKQDPLVSTALRKGAGRLLRAPTLWEEAVRILCTTNIQWGGTVQMMRGLVEIGGGGFPTPRQVLDAGKPRLQGEARMGYRADFLLRFADYLESGFQLEHWKTALPPQDELHREIASWPGFGPYATAHMLVQLGHYGKLPIDSEVRAFHAELWPGKKVDDKRIVKEYAHYGDYAFLAYKLRRIALKRNWIGG